MHGRVAEDFKREADLQGEALVVLRDLRLPEVLEAWGEPHLIGSMSMGLMVDRDIDFNVLVPEIGLDTVRAAYAALTSIVTHRRVSRLRYASQLGMFNPDGSRTEEGFYFGIHYRSEAGEPWKIDVWTLLPPRPEIELRDRLRRALSPDMRAAILAIKREFKDDAHGPAASGVHSRHVYEAALDGVRTMEEFTVWLEAHGLL